MAQNVKYRLFQKAYSDVQDSFSFVVLSPGCNNVTGNLTITYSPSMEDKSKININLRALEVDEGGSAVIETSHLYLHKEFLSDLSFNVTAKPKHGFLQTTKGDTERNNTDYFTLMELKSNFLHYIHDGSETQNDSFTFLALSGSEENFEFVGRFPIKVNLKNDNSPIRVIDKVFHIVVGGERALTGKS